MKHVLISMKPPYGTQIINQLDGTLLIKLERLRKKGMAEMLYKALEEVEAISETEPEETFKVIDLNKVVPDTGNPPMVMMKVKVSKLSDRDSLPADFRKLGRRVTVEENNVTYELSGGLSNEHWKEVENG